MPTLPRELRNRLAKTCLDARRLSERAARAALENLAVHEREYRGHMTLEQRQLRNRLRARARSLGDERRVDTGTQAIERLVEQTAYEHWHRLLFTRFLAENHLLMTDEKHGLVPVTLEDCAELAPELGAKDGVDLACRFASRQLPEIFRVDDPVLELDLALNDQVELRRLADALPTEVFTASDSLGWVYQFWQAERKDQVNASGKKIGAEELPAVTQLFTEDYMVEFLLHNTLGAWWAGKLGPLQAATEAEARAKAALPAKEGLAVHWTYLRFLQDEATGLWSPASGSYPGWPRQAALVTVLDPCMGSGHFLVFALPLLARLRMEEEGLSLARAVHAVLNDNLHGLEIDERCSQIAAFNLALTAWSLGGFQILPSLHLACSGLAPNASEKDWVALAGNDDRLKNGMAQLYSLFKDAPVLGSLINPRASSIDLMEAGFQELQPLLEKALTKEAKDDTELELAVTARGLTKAAELLANQFTLVTTNVPYLTRQGQCKTLREHCEQVFPTSKADLATCFLKRGAEFLDKRGTMSVVAPTNWLYQPAYKHFRRETLEKKDWHAVARLGPGAFDGISGEVVNVTLVIIGNSMHDRKVRNGFSIDATCGNSASGKAGIIAITPVLSFDPIEQLVNPDARVVLGVLDRRPLLKIRARSLTGLRTADNPYFMFRFWEIPRWEDYWEAFQSTVSETTFYGGKEHILRWERGCGQLSVFAELGLASIQGRDAWNKRGVTVSLMGQLPVSLYSGDKFDMNCGALWPDTQSDLNAIWAYCSSKEFATEVRKIDQQLKLTTATLLKVPFDLAHWQKVAEEKYPHGLPKPFSSDPTQWLFNGHPNGADLPLHVALARLVGYQWPRQTGSCFPDCPTLDVDGLEAHADPDGIVCLPSLQGDQPAVHRLRALLAAALDTVDEAALLAGAGPKGSKSRTLEEWLRDECFEQHCQIFHQRPFIWHIWDGRKDGFAALVNYHMLDNATLQKLTYSHIGAWIRQQEEDAKGNVSGAAERLGAARVLQQELIRILEGEAPYDIFVRWKPLKQQAVGWQPDLNDGVRMNIRPFLQATDVGRAGAGILRAMPKISWGPKADRGTEPNRPKEDYPWFWCNTPPGTDPKPGKVFVGSRWNDVHLTLDVKRQAHT